MSEGTPEQPAPPASPYEPTPPASPADPTTRRDQRPPAQPRLISAAPVGWSAPTPPPATGAVGWADPAVPPPQRATRPWHRCDGELGSHRESRRRSRPAWSSRPPGARLSPWFLDVILSSILGYIAGDRGRARSWQLRCRQHLGRLGPCASVDVRAGQSRVLRVLLDRRTRATSARDLRDQVGNAFDGRPLSPSRRPSLARIRPVPDRLRPIVTSGIVRPRPARSWVDRPAGLDRRESHQAGLHDRFANSALVRPAGRVRAGSPSRASSSWCSWSRRHPRDRRLDPARLAAQRHPARRSATPSRRRASVHSGA